MAKMYNKVKKSAYLILFSIIFFALCLIRPIFFYVATSIGCRGSDTRLQATRSYYTNLACTLYPLELIVFAIAFIILISDPFLIKFTSSWIKNRNKPRQISNLINLIIFLDLTYLLLFGDAHGNYQISEGYLYYFLGLVFQFWGYRTNNV